MNIISWSYILGGLLRRTTVSDCVLRLISQDTGGLRISPSCQTSISAAENALLPDTPQVERVVNILQRVTLYQQKICPQSLLDLPSIGEIEALRIQIRRSSQSLCRREATVLDKEVKLVVHTQTPGGADRGSCGVRSTGNSGQL